ncbi:molybdopterin cofactor-binding domain-containing protein [Minwuia sp.]|uniref:xanthine dehydrogenase family protein molybdopterin-binding subunit n=1 Tax=Minwuia sp. TaxID=2493630 RepID=UPI003A8D458B
MTKHEKIAVSRRSFLVGSLATGTLTMGYALMGGPLGIREAMAEGSFSPNIWFEMDGDGMVVVNITKAEMGQHVGTPLAQALAEELEVPWENVSIKYVSTAPEYGLFVTGGSWSVNWTFDQLSRAGAAGRIALMEGAVKQWGVPLAELTAENGMVMHAKSGRKISYGDLVKSGVTARNFSEEELGAIALKDPAKRKLVGKSVGALDIPGKTNGSAKFGIDVFVEGMVYGTPKVPPVRHGAKVTAVDESAAKKVAGYQGHVVIEDPTNTTTGWVVALADSYPQAIKVRDALKVTYDLGPNTQVSSATIMAEAEKLQKSAEGAQLFVKDGDSAKAMKGSKVTHEATYTTQLNIHAPLEPMNATVEVKDDVYHIHAGNQFQTLALGLVPAVLQIDPSQVVVHQYHLGGGFGRRLESDYILVAAMTAKAAGKPVKLIYSREADTTMDFSRTITHQVVRGGATDGKMDAMEQSVVSAWATSRQAPAFLADSVDKKGKVDPFSINGSDHWYTIPNQTVTTIMSPQAQSATPSGQLRSVAPGWTFWAVECFLDEMAHKAGKDPLAFKLDMLDATGKNAGTAPNSVGGAKRLANVLKVAAEKGGYGKDMGDGVGIGLAAVSAQERNSPTWTACAAQVKVDKATGDFRIQKLTLVIDVGTAVNPSGVEAQVQGGALWGTSLATKEVATMENGAIQQDNYDTYTPLRMEDIPEIDVTVLSTGHYPAGAGEPGVTVTAPAIANAIFAASGARVRDLPITPEKVKAAMG